MAPPLRYDVEERDLSTGSPHRLTPVHELLALIEREQRPDDPPAPLEERLDDLRRRPSYAHRRDWLAVDGEGMVVGLATLTWEDRAANREHADVELAVHRSVRRLGLASALLRRVAATSLEVGRPRLGGAAFRGGPAPAFLDAVGFGERQVERCSRLRTAEVDRARMRSWVDGAAERATDYELEGWDGPCPDARLEAFAEVCGVMNTAPRDGLDREDEVTTPDEIREWEKTAVETGAEWWTLCAVHRPTGRLAGYTQLGFNRWRPSLGWQGDTGVWPEHRERGLARWLKAAMILRVLDERPEVASFDTWNAASNGPMLRINVAMGYRPFEQVGAFQADARAVADRLDRWRGPGASRG